MSPSAPTRGYSLLDHPSILSSLLYPRAAPAGAAPPASAQDIQIPAADAGVVLGARLYLVPAPRSAPTLLFFHGNGEIADDYDGIAPLYARRGLNLLVVDYRGYGRSTGRATCSAMMRDCHPVVAHVTSWRAEHDHDGPLVVMGRSLGSASALEVASHYPDSVAGLIIESGFASTLSRLRFRGIDPERLGIEERDGFGNLDKIRRCRQPTLVIHGGRDRIIDCSEGRALHEASPAEQKRLLIIPGADHNDLLFVAMEEYMAAIGSLCAGLR